MLTGALYGMPSYLMRIGWKAVVKKRSSGEHSGRSGFWIITTEKQSQSVVKSMLDFDYIGVRPTGVVLVDQTEPTQNPRRTGGIEPCRCSWSMSAVSGSTALIVLPKRREIPQKAFDAFAEMGIVDPRKIADVNEMQGKNQTLQSFTATIPWSPPASIWQAQDSSC